MGWSSVVRALGFYLLYPITIIYSLFVALLGILSRPFLHVLVNVYYICKLPFRLLSKFEPLYTFFGVAAVFGILAGCFLHLTLRFMYSFFSLVQEDKEIETPARSSVNSMKQPRITDGNDDDDMFEPYTEHTILSHASKGFDSSLAVRRRRQWRLSNSSLDG